MKIVTHLILILVSVFCLMLNEAPAALEIPRQADTAKKCAICHYRWVYTFFVEHRSTPIAQLEEKKDVVGDREMCLSCHDGSIRDSRDKICNDPGHRIGVVPSKRVTIPEKFPLDANGAMQCVTCHTPHAVTAKSQSLVEFFLRAPNKNSSFCKQCHQENIGGKENGNHPVDVSVKAAPDRIREVGGIFGTELPNQVICETCHIAHGGVNSKFLVLPVEDTKTMSILCEVCHTKKPGQKPDASLSAFSHPLDIKPGTAAQIPAVWSNGDKVHLGTDGDLVCRTCHKPHQAADKEYLLADHKEGDALCMQCHKNQAGIAGTTHDLRKTAPHEKNILLKAASESGPCAPCHLVHAGTAAYMWARKIPAAGNAEALCASCHSPGRCGEKKAPKNFSHPMNIAVPEAQALPVYDLQGRINPKGAVNCMTCHNVHSPEPIYSTADIKRGKFLRMGSQGAAAHCIQCHPGQGLVRGTGHDMSVSASGYKNVLGQTPAQAALCGSCHAAHNAPRKEYIWAAPQGSARLPGWGDGTVQDNLIVTLCTGCHEEGRAGSKHIPRFGLHPQTFYCKAPEDTNALQQSGLPLFLDSGKISGDGAIVCATCHNAHQWNADKPIQGSGAAAEGTIQTSFLRKDLPGGFCANCHGRDALFKYLYFHNTPGREKRPKPFPFKE